MFIEHVSFPSSIQRDLYEESFWNLVESVLGGYNGMTVVENITCLLMVQGHLLGDVIQ